MIGSFRQNLIQDLQDKEFRTAYVSEHLRAGISHQIRALREQRGWSQAELGRKAGKPQSVISRAEDPDYGKFSLQTLLDLAVAFDVALFMRFISFSELLESVAGLSPSALRAVDFAHDDFRVPDVPSERLKAQMGIEEEQRTTVSVDLILSPSLGQRPPLGVLPQLAEKRMLQ